MADDRIFLVHTRSRKAICLGKLGFDGKYRGWYNQAEDIDQWLNRFYDMFQMSPTFSKEANIYRGDPRMFHLEYEEAALDFSWIDKLIDKENA